MRLLRRITPDTMKTRLVLTGALVAIVTAVVTIGIDAKLVSTQIDTWAREDAATSLHGLSTLLSLEDNDVRANLDRIAEVPEFRSLVLAGDPRTIDARYGRALLIDTGTYASAALDASGGVLVSSGSASDVARLRAIAAAGPSRETSGLVSMADSTAIVHGVPVLDPDSARRVGYLIAARLIGPDQIARISAIDGNALVSLHAAGYRPSDVTLRTVEAGRTSFLLGTAPSGIVTVQELRAIGGGSAGVVEIRDRVSRATSVQQIAILSALLSCLTAIIIGATLGIWATRAMRRPVHRMVEHVKTQGYLAAEGVPYPGDDLADDPTLPIEFRELSAVVEDLLRHLNARQAELKNAIREAEYAEDTLGVVVSESAEIKIVLQDGEIVIANPAAAAMLGVPAADLADRTLSSAFGRVNIHDEEGAAYDPAGMLEGALVEPLTVTLTLPGAAEHWYVVEAVRHADDLHNRILLTARDVTEERRLTSIRAEMISIISHDLRSPLTVVMGYLDLLTRPMKPEDRERALDAARRNAARMADLLEDLLTATRAEELLAPSELIPTRLLTTAEEVVNSLGPTHSERELLLETDCDPIVLGDEKRLRQILVNLVTNAYKYSPDPDPILVRLRCDDEHAYLEVIDHGPGIPAEEREHAFERFARLENGAGRPGVGLGLYIVNIIARNHGGVARVTETPGGGATFVVELPRAGDFVDGEVVLDHEPSEETPAEG